jgi:hypothetical protein
MLEILQEIIVGNSMYSVSGVVLLLLILFSIKSDQFYKGAKIILWVGIPLWVGSVAYEYTTGNSIFYLIDTFTQGESDSKKDVGAFQKYYSEDDILEKTK